MGDASKIEWTEATWNPVVGCTHVSEGCDHCYAAREASGRLSRHPVYAGLAVAGRFTGEVRLLPERLEQPLRWRKPRRVFVNSMSDLFHDDVPDGFIAQVWDVMGQCPQHIFQILTKRPGRMRSWVSRWADHAEDQPPRIVRGPEATRQAHPSGRGQLFAAMLESMGEPPEGFAYPTFDWMEGQRWWPAVLPNVWVGTSVESQKWADVRIPRLLETPAAVRFLSCEPLLGPLNLDGYLGPAALSHWSPGYQPDTTDHAAVAALARAAVRRRAAETGQPAPAWVDWVIVGGESGPSARPMAPDWARSLRDQCTAAGVPFFFKQWGEWMPGADLDPDLRERAVERLAGQEYVCHVGKKYAGRVLDGRTWDEYPEVAAHG